MTNFPTVVLLAMTVLLTACEDPFGKELQQHGYTMLLTIRGENPAGQIWAFSGNTEEIPPVRRLPDCFPGLQPHDVSIDLPAEKKSSQLSISAQVKYMPPASASSAAAATPDATPTVAAGLDFTQTKDVAISIGNATSSKLNAGDLEDYLSSHPVSSACLADLKNSGQPDHACRRSRRLLDLHTRIEDQCESNRRLESSEGRANSIRQCRLFVGRQPDAHDDFADLCRLQSIQV